MKAAIFRGGDIVVDTLPAPVPATGQALVKVLACGICGSDLHAAKDLRHFCELTASVGGLQTGLDPEAGIVFGHEYVAYHLANAPQQELPL